MKQGYGFILIITGIVLMLYSFTLEGIESTMFGVAGIILGAIAIIYMRHITGSPIKFLVRKK